MAQLRVPPLASAAQQLPRSAPCRLRPNHARLVSVSASMANPPGSAIGDGAGAAMPPL